MQEVMPSVPSDALSLKGLCCASFHAFAYITQLPPAMEVSKVYTRALAF